MKLFRIYLQNKYRDSISLDKCIEVNHLLDRNTRDLHMIISDKKEELDMCEESIKVCIVNEQNITDVADVKNVDIYIVQDLYVYESLYFNQKVDKNNIYIWNKEAEQLEKIINKLINRYDYKLLDFDYRFDIGKWQQQEGIYIDYNSLLKRYNIKSCLEKGIVKYVVYEGHKNRLKGNCYYRISFKAECDRGLVSQLFIVIFDERKKKYTYSVEVDQSKYIYLPKGSYTYKIMLRVQGTGEVWINNITIGEIENLEEVITSNNKYLILTNAYVSTANLYKNAFIHRRVKNYIKEGVNVDVFVINNQEGLVEYTYDGIRVLGGNKQMLSNLLKAMPYKKVLIHFANQDMIEAIEKAEIDTQIILWIHGYGAERYHRRIYNYTPEYLQDNKAVLEERDNKQMALMKKLYCSKNVTTVFVSKYIKQIAEEDAGCEAHNSVIIPNIIDCELFKYKKKPLHQRKRILFIRPFTAKNYACDIAMKVILELSKRECFKDLVFDIYGRGPLFEETVAPVRRFKNVNLNEVFLTQQEIAYLHKTHGMMLIPTRHDTQGVSMGEAMSSGLVVATNSVCAITEYIDETCGILAPGEDWKVLADKIEELYYKAELWENLSEEASKRVRTQCGMNNTIAREIEMICNI